MGKSGWSSANPSFPPPRGRRRVDRVRRPRPLNKAALEKIEKAEASSNDKTRSEVKLTFGLEFEYALCLLQEQFEEFSGLETEQIVAYILNLKGLPSRVTDPKVSRPESWCCTDEHFDVHGSQASIDVLPPHIPREKRDWSHWERFPSELVSRRFEAPFTDVDGHVLFENHAVMQEIRRYLEALEGSGDDWHTAFVPEDVAGLHMHVGTLPTDENPRGQLPLRVIQHLAFLVSSFEPLMSSLQPYSRRALGKDWHPHLESNLMGLRRSRHICSRDPLPAIAEIEAQLFKDDITTKEISDMMGSMANSDITGRFKFVSFFRLRKPRALKDSDIAPATIEFRQHEGTLRMTDVSRWVELIIHLVRAAERLANADELKTPLSGLSETSRRELRDLYNSAPFHRKQGMKYRPKCSAQAAEFERFFDLLKLSRSARQYWRERYAKCNPDDVIDDKAEHYSMGTGYREDECPFCFETAAPAEQQAKREKDERANAIELERAIEESKREAAGMSLNDEEVVAQDEQADASMDTV